MQNIDLYAEEFDEKLLQSIYKYFDEVLGNPSTLCTQQQILNEQLNNERQKVIKMDCLRTRSTSFDQKIKDELQIMLTHYCRVFGIKYKQGLNEIGGPFIYFRKINIPITKCQALFHQFFVGYCLNFYDDDNFSSVQLFMKMFSVVLKYHDPALARYLQCHNIEPQLFCINWLMTLFASKLSFKLVYLLWRYLATEKDKFLLFFLILAIVQINRQNIIESKNINILQVVTDLIFKDVQSLNNVVERALLLRKNTPSSIILFFRDRMIFQKRQKFSDVSKLLQHMEKLNLFVILPGQMTIDQHLLKGSCQNQCYFCDLGKPIPQSKQNCCSALSKLIQISNDIRLMNYKKQYVLMDLRLEQSKQILYNGSIFKVNQKETIQQIQQRFLSQFIEDKGKKHFVIILKSFSFEDLHVCNAQQFERCKKMIKTLNSLSFPLLSILQGGFDAYLQQQQSNIEKVKAMQSMIDSQSLYLCSYELPYSFPMRIRDRCRLGTAFCNDQAITFIGIVEILIIFDYFIFILPIEKDLLSFVNYFQHNKSVMQYLYERPHVPSQLMVHRVISMRSLKKASMKIHNQNILVLLYDSCEHQQKRIFPQISKYLQMDINTFEKLGEVCKNCIKNKNKIVLQMNENQTVRDCVTVLTNKYMHMRKKLKANEQIF